MPRLLAAALATLMTVPALAGPPSDAVFFFYDPVRWEADPELRDRFTGPAKTLFDLNDKMPEGEMGCLDFAPSIDAQDYDDETVSRTLELAEEVDGSNATVTARFSLFPGAPEDGEREIRWRLVEEGGDWKVADIASASGGWRLSDFECRPEE